MGSVLATGREPMISEIRLAWWRDSLDRLDREPPPPEPVLAALARHVLPAGVAGAELAEMAPGWAALLSTDAPDAEALDLHAQARGGRLFALSARLLGDPRPEVKAAGELWALVDLARRSGREAEARAALAAARRRQTRWRWPAPLRPLGMLAVLAVRDAERGVPLRPRASPRRILRMMRHRLTGR